MKHPKLVILHGLSGDLSRRFGIGGLYNAYECLWAESGEKPQLSFIGTAGSDVGDLSTFINTAAQKFKVEKGPHWEQFVASWSFVQGRCSDRHAAPAMARAISQWLEQNPTGRWSAYLAIQLMDAANNNLNIASLRCMDVYGPKLLQGLDLLCFEKPAAKFEPDYRTLSELATKLGIADRAACVDHYAFKHGAEVLLDLLLGEYAELINPQTVIRTTQRIYETLGLGERAQYLGPMTDTMPHAHATHHISRPWGKTDTLQQLFSGAPTFATFNPREESALQQRQLEALNVGARYFYRQGDEVPTGYYIAFTPLKGRWAGIPAHWAFVKCSDKKLVEMEYQIKPTNGTIAESYTFCIERSVPEDGRSYGLRHEIVKRGEGGRRVTKRDEWTLPVAKKYGNGYGQVFWDVVHGDQRRMLTLESQCQGVCFSMAVATWLEYHHKGKEQGITYLEGLDPCSLIVLDQEGHPAQRPLLECGNL